MRPGRGQIFFEWTQEIINLSHKRTIFSRKRWCNRGIGKKYCTASIIILLFRLANEIFFLLLQRVFRTNESKREKELYRPHPQPLPLKGGEYRRKPAPLSPPFKGLQQSLHNRRRSLLPVIHSLLSIFLRAFRCSTVPTSMKTVAVTTSVWKMLTEVNLATYSPCMVSTPNRAAML